MNIFLTVLSWKYDEQEYENIAQLLQTDENGIFEFEKVLQKETLTEEEIEALGNMDVAKLQTQILQDAGLVLYRRGYPTEGTGGYGYGQWWSDSRLSIEDAREQLAILENWGNPLTGEYEMTVPQGTKAITGIAEEQYFYDDITGELLEHRGGGAKQYWFNSINESWIK